MWSPCPSLLTVTHMVVMSSDVGIKNRAFRWNNTSCVSAQLELTRGLFHLLTWACLSLLIVCGLCTSVILKVTQLMPSVCSSLLVCNEERHCVMAGYTDAYTDVSGVFDDPHMTAVSSYILCKSTSLLFYDVEISLLPQCCAFTLPRAGRDEPRHAPPPDHLIHTFTPSRSHKPVNTQHQCRRYVPDEWRNCSVGVLWLHC